RLARLNIQVRRSVQPNVILRIRVASVPQMLRISRAYRQTIMQFRETPQSKIDYRWVVLVAATTAQAAASFVTQGLGVLAGFLQEDLWLTSLQVGLLMAAATAAPIVMLPFVGDLLDRRSERVIVATGAVVLAVGLVLSALAPGFVYLLAALLIVGCGYSTT